jgi:predicted MFS family arabinose efflux permease
VLAGAYIAAAVDWRTSFLVIGFAGMLVAPVFKLLVGDRKPAPVQAASDAPSLRTTAGKLARQLSFWLLAFGAAMASMIGYGLAFWLPSLLQRSFGLDLVQTSHFIGAVLLIGGVAGMLLGGWLGDRLGSRDRAFFAWVPAIAFVVAVPLFAWGIHSASVWLAFALFLVPQALSYMWFGPVLTAVQHLVTPPERATASALFLAINNLIGLGGGIYALGALSEELTPHFGNEALRYSMLFGLVLYLFAALLLALAGPGLRRAWVTDDAL